MRTVELERSHHRWKEEGSELNREREVQVENHEDGKVQIYHNTQGKKFRFRTPPMESV